MSFFAPASFPLSASMPPRTTSTRGLAVHSGTPTPENSSSSASFAADLTPLDWTTCFDRRRMLRVQREKDHADHDEFCVYTAEPRLSGDAAPSAAAGSASRSSSHTPSFLVVLLHGGGQSSLAWGCVAGLLKSALDVMAFDLRGHGGTRTTDDADLSMPRLVSDVVNVVKTLYARPPPLLLIGHSLGGALAVHVTASKRLPVAGLVVVDLVEGTAISSLDHMTSVLASRPASFPSPEDAIHWSLLSGAMRNVHSARLSVPDQLVPSDGSISAASSSNASTSTAAATSSVAFSSPSAHASYRWRTDLLASQPHWSGWFTGLSSLFLSCALPKLLVLAGSDRLDTPLMVAHMQGKLQLELLPHAGHSVQEDQPRDTARALAGFVARHQLQTRGATWAKQSQAAVPAPAASPMPP